MYRSTRDKSRYEGNKSNRISCFHRVPTLFPQGSHPLSTGYRPLFHRVPTRFHRVLTLFPHGLEAFHQGTDTFLTGYGPVSNRHFWDRRCQFPTALVLPFVLCCTDKTASTFAVPGINLALFVLPRTKPKTERGDIIPATDSSHHESIPSSNQAFQY